MTAVSTKLYKLDFKDLIKNAKNEKYWDKTWEIFRYGDVSVKFFLSSINISDRKMSGTIKLEGVNKHIRSYYYGYSMTSSMTIPLQESNYNESALEKQLCGKVNDLFINLGCREITLTSEYEELEQAEYALRDRLKEIAEEFLDSEGVENETIRDVYIDNYVDVNEKNFTSDYLSQHKYNKFIEHRATFFYIMGFDDRAKDVISRSKDVDCDWILEEAEELRSQLENDEMEEFEENLESI